MDESKACKVCGERKPLTDFYEAAGCVDGRRGDCRECFQAKAKARKEADSCLKEIAAERTRQWRKDNPEKYADLVARTKANGTYARSLRKWHLRTKFGLTVEDFEQMKAEQGGCCAICRRPPRNDRTLHVDHDHDTGRVRRLLCFTCNAGMGMFDHDPVLLIEAADYLIAFAELEAAEDEAEDAALAGGADGTSVGEDSR